MAYGAPGQSLTSFDSELHSVQVMARASGRAGYDNPGYNLGTSRKAFDSAEEATNDDDSAYQDCSIAVRFVVV